MDGENMALIASKASKQANKLVSVSRYDVDKVIKNLRKKVVDDKGNFDWGALGAAVGTCFNTVPRVFFMNGPVGEARVQKVVKEKKKRVRVDEEAEEEVRREEGGGAKRRRRVGYGYAGWRRGSLDHLADLGHLLAAAAHVVVADVVHALLVHPLHGLARATMQ